MSYPNLSRHSGSSLFFFVACLIIISVGLGDTWPQGISVILIFQTALILVFILLFVAINKNINIYFLLFFTFLIWGIVGSLIYQNDIVSIIRDFGPMLFLVLPLASKYLGRSLLAEIDTTFLIYLVIFSSLLISIRFIFPYFSLYGFDISSLYATHFFPNRDPNFHDPTLLFSCVFSIVYLLTNKNNFTLKVYLLSATFLILFIHFVAILRAPISFYAVALIAGVFYRSNLRLILLISLFIISIFLYYSEIIFLFDSLIDKFEKRFDNGKLAEALVIYEFLDSHSSWAVIFGAGFGSEYLSELTGSKIKYAHTIFSYILLKFGIFGLIVFSPIYLALIFNFLYSLYKSYICKNSFSYSLNLATFSVFISYTLTQPAFKSISFSILLFIYFLHKSQIRFLS